MDSISDFLIQIKNAQMARIPYIEVYTSRVKEQIAEILKARGFVGEISRFKPQGKAAKRLRIDLIYEGGEPRIMEIRRISKGGRRVYRRWMELKSVKGGFGVAVVSTSRGILSDDEARKRNLGGEIICEVW